MKFRNLIAVFLSPIAALAQNGTSRIQDLVKDFPRSQLQPDVTYSLSVGPTVNVRSAYETLAGGAGLHVLFDADVHDTKIPIHVESHDVLSALDAMSVQTGTFVEVLDSKTILVAPDNPAKRRDDQTLVLKAFYPAIGVSLDRIVVALRTVLNARNIATDTKANAIVMRDTPDRIAQADQVIEQYNQTSSSAPLAMEPAGRLLTLENGNIRDVTPVRSLLRLQNADSISLSENEDSRTAFEEAARAGGLNIVFARDFHATPVALHIDKIRIADALDRLSLESGNFWEALDDNTVVVAPDNPSKRRDLELQVAKTFYLPEPAAGDLTEVVTAIRSVLNCRYIARVDSANAIIVRDTPGQMALVEKIIGDLQRPLPSSSAAAIAIGSESGFPIQSEAVRVASNSTAAAPRLSFDLKGTVRQAYEAIASQTGLQVAFDTRFQNHMSSPLKLTGVTIEDALNSLSLETGNMWTMSDPQTIVVGPDSPAVRNDIQRRVVKVLKVSNPTPASISERIIALRTLLNLRYINPGNDGIVIQDSEDNIAHAEKILSTLEHR